MAEKTEAGEIQAQIRTLGDEIARLAALVKDLAQSRAGTLGDELAAASQEIGEKARAAMRDEVAAIEKQIVEKPLQSTLIALVAGLVLGAILRR
jgi:ElaB/YqjD/DUF883 family membrane-anchored ribosome-binding protein